MHDVIEDLLGQMTLQEKVALLAGTDGWYTAPVERLGIPSLGITDGPKGAFTVRFFEHGDIGDIRDKCPNGDNGDIGDNGDNGDKCPNGDIGDIGDKCRSTRTPCLGD